MKYLLPVYTNVEEYSHPDFAVVTLTKEALTYLKTVRKVLNAARKSLEETYEIFFWDHVGVNWYGGEYDNTDAENEEVQAAKERIDALVDSFNEPIRVEDFDEPSHTTSTECDQLVVSDEGIKWVAYMKHGSGAEISTERIPWEDLK